MVSSLCHISRNLRKGFDSSRFPGRTIPTLRYTKIRRLVRLVIDSTAQPVLGVSDPRLIRLGPHRRPEPRWATAYQWVRPLGSAQEIVPRARLRRFPVSYCLKNQRQNPYEDLSGGEYLFSPSLSALHDVISA